MIICIIFLLQWCFKKKCVEIGSRPDAVNGGWGDWQAYSECSRTCGGGVSSSERECNNPVPKHGGRFCLGDRKRIKICNLTVSLINKFELISAIICSMLMLKCNYYSLVLSAIHRFGNFNVKNMIVNCLMETSTLGRPICKKVSTKLFVTIL